MINSYSKLCLFKKNKSLFLCVDCQPNVENDDQCVVLFIVVDTRVAFFRDGQLVLLCQSPVLVLFLSKNRLHCDLCG